MQMKYGIGCENRHNLDSKRRIFVPARIRDLLGKDLVVALHAEEGQHCLAIYSAQGWDDRVERSLKKAKSEAERNKRLRRLNHLQIAAELDEQGRVTLTKGLVDYAGLVKEVVIEGAGDHALMWDAKTYDDMNAGIDDFAELEALLNEEYDDD